MNRLSSDKGIPVFGHAILILDLAHSEKGERYSPHCRHRWNASLARCHHSLHLTRGENFKTVDVRDGAGLILQQKLIRFGEISSDRSSFQNFHFDFLPIASSEWVSD